MAQVENYSGVPHLLFEQTGPEGELLDVLVIRATFDFAESPGSMPLSQTQSPVCLGDQYSGPVEDNPLLAVLSTDGDLLPYKPGTDIVVEGVACAPNGVATTTWDACIRVGALEKHLRLFGPRDFSKGFFRWSISQPIPVTHVPLDYRLAFGGLLAIPLEGLEPGALPCVWYADNPAGLGWLPKARDLQVLDKRARKAVIAEVRKIRSLRAHQIESASEQAKSPFGRPNPAGLAGVPRWIARRLKVQGTCDGEWREKRYPLLPLDFDSRFYQCASDGLVATPHLTGGEPVSLTGLLPQRVDMVLPSWRPLVVCELSSGLHIVQVPLLDTLRFHLETKTMSMVWRTHCRRDDPVSGLVIGATTEGVDHRLAVDAPKGVAL